MLRLRIVSGFVAVLALACLPARANSHVLSFYGGGDGLSVSGVNTYATAPLEGSWQLTFWLGGLDQGYNLHVPSEGPNVCDVRGDVTTGLGGNAHCPLSIGGTGSQKSGTYFVPWTWSWPGEERSGTLELTIPTGPVVGRALVAEDDRGFRVEGSAPTLYRGCLAQIVCGIGTGDDEWWDLHWQWRSAPDSALPGSSSCDVHGSIATGLESDDHCFDHVVLSGTGSNAPGSYEVTFTLASWPWAGPAFQYVTTLKVTILT